LKKAKKKKLTWIASYYGFFFQNVFQNVDTKSAIAPYTFLLQNIADQPANIGKAHGTAVNQIQVAIVAGTQYDNNHLSNHLYNQFFCTCLCQAKAAIHPKIAGIAKGAAVQTVVAVVKQEATAPDVALITAEKAHQLAASAVYNQRAPVVNFQIGLL
jgi:hypothetical protein